MFRILFIGLSLATAYLPSAFAQNAPDIRSDAATPLVDPYGRNTPEGLVSGFVLALAADDYLRASRFLDIEGAGLNAERAAERVVEFQTLLDSSGVLVPARNLSRSPRGDLNDGLPLEVDQIGSFRVNGESVPILAHVRSDPDFGTVWQITPETLAAIPDLLADDAPSTLFSFLPDTIATFEFAGAPVVDWLALLFLAAASYAIVSLVTWFVLKMWKLISRRINAGAKHEILEAIALPLSVYLSIVLFFSVAERLGVAIVARQSLLRFAEVFGWISFAWLLWRLIHAIADINVRRMVSTGHRRGASAVIMGRRIAKISLVVLAAIAVLDTVGFDVTTGLAALGIGGLAIALGAQKSVENFVGSLAVIADQPVRTGDFCRVGEVTGTVENIGMRSTRIRTQARTIITIPNADFSTRQIENYERRDRFWFHHVLNLRYETTPDQLRAITAQIGAVLQDHPKVDEEPLRVRFLKLGQFSLDIDVHAYVAASDFSEFLEIQEGLLLTLMDVVADGGSAFAFPSSTLYIEPDTGLPRPMTALSEETPC